MNLHKDIHRIQSLLTENREEMIKNMIDKHGLYHAIKLMGNYYLIEPYLKEIDKVNYIKEKVSQICDEFGANGFGLVEVDSAPIFYSEDEDELRQIEYLGRKQLYVDVYSSDTNSNLGDFKVSYESLPGQILDELVEVFINY